jgi:RES domain-containing protein
MERRCVAGASCALRTRDATGSTIASGRFHRAQAQYPTTDHWRALYLSLGPDIPIGEILRRFGSHRPLAGLRSYRRTRLHADLSAVLDCRDLAALGLTEEALLDDLNYDIGHALGLIALRRGVEGILVPSATRAGDNLIVLPDNLRPTAHIEPTTDIIELTHFIIP